MFSVYSSAPVEKIRVSNIVNEPALIDVFAVEEEGPEPYPSFWETYTNYMKDFVFSYLLKCRELSYVYDGKPHLRLRRLAMAAENGGSDIKTSEEKAFNERASKNGATEDASFLNAWAGLYHFWTILKMDAIWLYNWTSTSVGKVVHSYIQYMGKVYDQWSKFNKTVHFSQGYVLVKNKNCHSIIYTDNFLFYKHTNPGLFAQCLVNTLEGNTHNSDIYLAFSYKSNLEKDFVHSSFSSNCIAFYEKYLKNEVKSDQYYAIVTSSHIVVIFNPAALNETGLFSDPKLIMDEALSLVESYTKNLSTENRKMISGLREKLNGVRSKRELKKENFGQSLGSNVKKIFDGKLKTLFWSMYSTFFVIFLGAENVDAVKEELNDSDLKMTIDSNFTLDAKTVELVKEITRLIQSKLIYKNKGLQI